MKMTDAVFVLHIPDKYPLAFILLIYFKEQES